MPTPSPYLDAETQCEAEVDRPMQQAGDVFETDLPARLDRLRWSRFHTLIVVALGITWILDGLEVTLAGSVAGVLQSSHGLSLSEAEVGAAASAYLAGVVLGAVGFGRLADLWGRRKLLFLTLGLYLAATACTALSVDFWTYAFFRFLTGTGIGGEYSAINSAIQEFIPARFRGRTDIAINGSYWFGAAFGAVGTVLLLDPRHVPPALGWRLAFGIGAVLGMAILLLRRFVPESPRWLMIHGRLAEADAGVAAIERRVRPARPLLSLDPPLRLRVRAPPGIGEVAMTLIKVYPRRTFVGLSLMAGQAFLYNAIFFTYALVLGRFFHVGADKVGLYLLPFALANATGAILLSPLFDIIGRRAMIGATYALSGLLLALGGWLFMRGALGAGSMTAMWTAVFFFASPAASSAYLTVSESFPLEMRALAISIFLAAGTALGGVAAPALFGVLIGSGDRAQLFDGYLVGAGLMLAAGFVAMAFGVDAERRSLEELAPPLATLPSQGRNLTS
ncbi:MAG: MFS transporter [Caulobacteraceae bacterium]